MWPDPDMHAAKKVIDTALTIDLEDWYHGLTRTNVRPELWPELTGRAEEATAQLLDILAEENVRATFFVLGDLARRSPGLVRCIAQNGHELASHGYSHRPVHQLTPATFREELDQVSRLIEDITGQRVIGFRAPYFSIDSRCLWAFEVLIDAGYQYDSSVFPLKTILYGYPGASRYPYLPLPGADLMEYPIATTQIAGRTFPFAGGFYGRVFPYTITRWGVRRLNREGYPAIIYLHPWELDLNQPRIPVSPRERLTHYTGRSSVAGKLKRLCRDFSLRPLREVHRQWSTLT